MLGSIQCHKTSMLDTHSTRPRGSVITEFVSTNQWELWPSYITSALLWTSCSDGSYTERRLCNTESVSTNLWELWLSYITSALRWSSCSGGTYMRGGYVTMWLHNRLPGEQLGEGAFQDKKRCLVAQNYNQIGGSQHAAIKIEDWL